ncbi:carboxymuconolactone decarboxylase family protein [Geodermatophilus sp. URMC 65]|jgi:AhpD family alkylhydroperoxidase
MTFTAEYDRLFIDEQSPDVHRSMSAVAPAVTGTAEAAGWDQLLVELVDIRISPLNGCGFCLDLHVRRAVDNGETPQRLAVRPAWRDVDLFSPTEQAALALAEGITMLPDHHTGARARPRARAADRRPVLGDQLDHHHDDRLQPDLRHQRASGAPARLLTAGRTRLPCRGGGPGRSGQGRGRTVRTRMTWSRNSAM